jgi:uncharacterized protein YqeY
MPLLERIQTDITAAMRAKDELRLNTLRSVKTALERYRTDQQKPIDEAVEQSTLKTLAKQRREAADAFRNGGREEAAVKEEAELQILEGYMLQQATEAEIDTAVETALGDFLMTLHGPVHVATIKDMGTIMKGATAKLSGKRVDGKMLSGKVKARLAPV